MDRVLMEYAVNAAWQLPVLATGAWLLVRVAKPGAAAQYRIWVGVLALAVVLPLMGALTDSGARVEVAATKTDAAPGAVLESASPVSARPVGVVTSGVDAMNAATGMDGSADAQSVAAHAAKLSEAGSVREGWIAKAEAMWGSLRLTRRIEMSARAAEWVTGVYLLVMLLGLMRIVRAWSRARRLAEDSYAETLTDDERALVAECARRMGMPGSVAGSAMGPEVRVVDDADALQGPVVVGARRPVLLCPEGFVRGLLRAGREDEAVAALCHEMAHIRRRDYAANLLCEAMAVPLKWHPVTYGVERRIRATREMACDAMAAHAMESDAEYARCLVGLAERMTAGGLMEQAGAVGLFNGNALEERVMRLMETGETMSVRAKVVRGMAGAAAMAAAVALAGMVHVVPARAQAADQVVAPAAVPGPAKLKVDEPEKPASPVVAAAKGKEDQPRIFAGKDLPPVVALTSNPSVAPKVLLLADAQAGKGSVPEVIELEKPGQKASLRVLTPVHGVVKLSKVAPVKVVTIADVQPKVHVVMAVRPVMKVVKVAPVVAVTADPIVAVDPMPQAQPAPQTTPAPPPAPAPAPAPKAVKPYHHEAIVSRDGKMYVWENGKERELTPAERARMEKRLEDAQRKLAADSARFNSPGFKEQIEKAEQDAREAERKIESGEIQRQLAEVQKQLNSTAFKARISKAQEKAMADMQRELNSPEFKARMAEAQKRADEAMAKLQSPEFKKQMEEAQQKALSNMDAQMAAAKKQMAEAMAKMNSPEFKAQIDKQQREAMELQRKLMNGDFQRQMTEAQKEIQKQLDELKAQDGKNGK